MNLKETIRQVSSQHIKNYFLFGQCLTAVGWVNGTVPEEPENKNLIELPMSDVMNGGIVVGSALVGKRPIYIIRYQGFNWFNAPMILNYAAKCKELWNYSCPIFIRSLAMEGGVGPVASASHHGIYNRMPGIKIAAPITPNEWINVYNDFMNDDIPYYINEHRQTYNIDYEINDIIENNAEVTIFAISINRINAIEAIKILNKENIKINLINIVYVKPFNITKKIIKLLNNSKYGLIIDNDYANGVAKNIANELMLASNTKIYSLTLNNRTCGFSPETDNLPPSIENIVNYIKNNKKNNEKFNCI